MSKCCNTPIPRVVKKLLTCSDKLLFTATYDVTKFGAGDTTPVNVSIVPNAYSIINIPNTSFQALPALQQFMTEYYNLTSFSQNLEKQRGYISFTNTYPSDNDITSIPAIEFPVAAKSGIYEYVDKVVIDYTNDIRVIYFFRKC